MMIYEIKNRGRVFLLLALMLVSFGCKDQDEMYKQYVTTGGITYPCKAENATAKPGIGKVYISWPNTTATVTKAGIWWNNYGDSIMVDIAAGTDTVSVSIDIKEGIYSFFIKTFDKNGNVSIPVEVIGRSIGDKYLSGFHNRSISGYKTKGLNSLIIGWDDADASKGALHNEIIYTATDNTEKLIRIPVSEKSTEINDHKAGTAFKYNTVYQPDPEEELIVATSYKSITNAYLLLDKSIGKVIDKSSTHPDATCDEKGIYDGDYLKSRWRSANGTYPHFVTVDLGAETSIVRLVIWPSCYDNKPDKRMPSEILWEISLDNVNWTTLDKYGYLYDPTETIWDPREYIISPVNARYIRLTGLDDPSGTGVMIFGELDVYSAIGEISDPLTPPIP